MRIFAKAKLDERFGITTALTKSQREVNKWAAEANIKKIKKGQGSGFRPKGKWQSKVKGNNKCHKNGNCKNNNNGKFITSNYLFFQI